ncbi:MAG TPA: iron-sulfur cluster assembly scaffold protein [Gemmatimonadaceae bacterium]|nr:iron-sulfur cluster assembly scaffold protein [Gemmatimonadaceae bacterium]
MYSGIVLEHFRRPRNHRALEAPTAAHEANNPLCGDRVRVEIRVEDGVVREAAFTANACAVCTASASMLTERVIGLSAQDAARLGGDDALAALETPLPAARVACATLPLRALHGALAQRSVTV